MAGFDWADGADQVDAASLTGLLPDGSFPVWQENVPTIAFFISVRRCWMRPPLGGKVTGMNWTEIRAKMQMKGFDAPRQALELSRLEMMEEAILEVMA